MTKETATFDLFSVLADREFPTDTVTVYFNEVLMRDILKINKELERLSIRAASKDADIASAAAEAFTILDDKFEAEKVKLREQQFVVHLKGIPPTRKSAIDSKALHAVPMKIDLYNREDRLTQLERGVVFKKLIFAAYIEKIVAPNGATQDFTGDDGPDLAAALVDQAPDATVLALDAAIGALIGDIDLDVFEKQDLDFLS